MEKEQDDVTKLRKMVSCLEQHNGLRLSDAIPSIMEVLNMNCTVLKSLNINSLIQIGYYVLQDAHVQHKETNEYISTLVAVILNSAANESKEETALKENFLFAVWCKTDTLSLPVLLHEQLTMKWKLYLQQLLLNLIVKCHAVHDSQYQQHVANIFASPDIIFFLNVCRRSPLIFQATVMTFTAFLIHKKGCSIIQTLIKEFIKLVECYSKEKLSSLFPPRYKSLVSCLQRTPDLISNDTNALELLITTFREEKYSGMAFVSCFPVWLPVLVKYYSQKYKTNFFTDFNF